MRHQTHALHERQGASHEKTCLHRRLPAVRNDVVVFHAARSGPTRRLSEGDVFLRPAARVFRASVTAARGSGFSSGTCPDDLGKVPGLDVAPLVKSALDGCMSSGDFLRVFMTELARQQQMERWMEATPTHVLCMADIKRLVGRRAVPARDQGRPRLRAVAREATLDWHAALGSRPRTRRRGAVLGVDGAQAAGRSAETTHRTWKCGSKTS